MVNIFGLEDIELQEEASLGLECGNGQMDLPSHFQNGVQDNQTIMVLKINCLFQAIGVKGGLGMIFMKASKFPLFANAGALFENSKFLCICILNPLVVRRLLYLLAHFPGRRRHQTRMETFLFTEQPGYIHKV